MSRALIVGILLLGAPPLQAQNNCTANPSPCSTAAQSITITINPAMQLMLSAGSTTLASPTQADFNTGFAATPGPTATMRSNGPWILAISAGSATWTASDTQSEPARTDKPAGDLKWAISESGPFTALGASPVTVATGTATLGWSTAFFYQTLYSWGADTPGTYSLQLVFTMTAP